MAHFTTLKRIFVTTGKQIRRSEWLGLASVSIMTLAILVLTVFLSIAFLSELFLQSLENKPHIYIFFKTGVKETTILKFKKQLEDKEKIDFVDYTSEAGAKKEFITHNKINKNPLIAAEIKERSLPASLSIRLHSLEHASSIIDMVEAEAKTNKNIFAVRYSQQTIDNLRNVVLWLRIFGLVIMMLLTIVIILFTLLTVEFRTYSRSKEIQIMQLVGGSLWYIRMPFIVEGGFYGFIGALISNIILISIGLFGWYSTATSTTKSFLIASLGDLHWPQLDLISMISIFAAILLIGFTIGAFNSIIAIRRYIK